MNQQNNKNLKNYLIVVVFAVFIIIAGISLAFFAPQLELPGSDVSVEMVELADLNFDIHGGLAIRANATNFAPGEDSLSDTTGTTVTLTASDQVDADYYVYFQIEANEFIYTTGADETPELVLKVMLPDGTELQSVEGLDYVTTADGLTGFDVTTKQGLITLYNAYPIETDGITPTVQEWEFTLYFVNLDSNQNENNGIPFESNLIFSRDSLEDYTYLEKLSTQILLDDNKYIYKLEEAVDYIEGKITPDFNYNATTDEGLFAYEDAYGTSYYYRGAVIDNWVEFAGAYWRIVRVDGNGNIKLIYSGTDAPADNSAVMTGAGTQIGTSTFQDTTLTLTDTDLLYQSVEGAGYVYTDGELHGTTTDSLAKETLDQWYTDNLASYDSMLATTEYCIDRNSYTRDGSSGSYTWTPNDTTVTTDTQYFGSTQRVGWGKEQSLSDTVTPSLKCTTSSDKLNLKIGLITLDEASLAGGSYGNVTLSGVANDDYYLYTGQTYWTLSPYNFSSFAIVGFVHSSGFMSSNNDSVSNAFGLRPVVTLNSETLVSSGTGTGTDPYVIEMN